MNGPGEPNDALVTVPGMVTQSRERDAPAEGDGNWAHAYFEAYMQTRHGRKQLDPTPHPDGPRSGRGPIQGLKNFGFGGSSITAPAISEIDFFETYGTIFGQTPGNWTATMHQWPANASSDGHNNKRTTAGTRTVVSGLRPAAGAGQVKFFYDGAQVDATVDSGTGQTQFSLETMSQFIVLGCGKGWDLNVDWVRVWQ